MATLQTFFDLANDFLHAWNAKCLGVNCTSTKGETEKDVLSDTVRPLCLQ